jgi:hypothetical protein
MIREERSETKVMIPLEVLDSYPLTTQGEKALQNGQIVRKGKRLPGKTEKEFEKVSQDHPRSHSLFLRIQKSEKGLHLSRFSSGKVGIGDKYPVLSGTGQSHPLPTPE